MPESFETFLREPRNATGWYVHGLPVIGDDIAGCGAVIMGILNCTPDSFFDGGHWEDPEQAVARGRQMVEQGACIIDVGGESSRPGADPVSPEEETNRIVPVIQQLNQWRHDSGKSFFLSVDTVKSQVARKAVQAGADIINDISAMESDLQMFDVIVESGAGVILNHMQGTPATMQKNPVYANVVDEVLEALLGKAHKLTQAGVVANSICLDPGIGFGKSPADNYRLIAGVSRLVQSGFPILMGMSRKSYIGKTEGLENSDRLIPSLVSAVLADLGGAAVIRVHDVPETKEALTMVKAVRGCLTEKD